MADPHQQKDHSPNTVALIGGGMINYTDVEER